MKRGFTLAEVLITLGIIGVVAALTLPSLIDNYKKQEYVARLQKGISILNNGFRLMMANEEVNDFDQLELQKCNPNVASASADFSCISPYFKKYFNIVEDNSKPNDDFYPYLETLILSGSKNGLIGSLTIKIYYSFITTDGILFTPFSYGGIGDAIIDVNGKRKPNQVGRDIFVLENNNGTFIPKGSKTWDDSSSNDYCDTKSGVGYGCAARIVAKGWKMDY